MRQEMIKSIKEELSKSTHNVSYRWDPSSSIVMQTVQKWSRLEEGFYDLDGIICYSPEELSPGTRVILFYKDTRVKVGSNPIKQWSHLFHNGYPITRQMSNGLINSAVIVPATDYPESSYPDYTQIGHVFGGMTRRTMIASDLISHFRMRQPEDYRLASIPPYGYPVHVAENIDGIEFWVAIDQEQNLLVGGPNSLLSRDGRDGVPSLYRFVESSTLMDFLKDSRPKASYKSYVVAFCTLYGPGCGVLDYGLSEPRIALRYLCVEGAILEREAVEPKAKKHGLHLPPLHYTGPIASLLFDALVGQESRIGGTISRGIMISYTHSFPLHTITYFRDSNEYIALTYGAA